MAFSIEGIIKGLCTAAGILAMMIFMCWIFKGISDVESGRGSSPTSSSSS